MKTAIENHLELDIIIQRAVAPCKQKTDFDLRKELIGCGFTAASYSRQFHDVGTEEYKYLCINLTDKLSEMSRKAYEGTKKYDVEIEYKSKNKPNIFGYACTEEERTEEEVIERIKQQTFYDPNTNRKIKPIFLKMEIKLNGVSEKKNVPLINKIGQILLF